MALEVSKKPSCSYRSKFANFSHNSVKALIQAELQDSKAGDRALEVDDKAAGKRPIV